MASRKTQPQPLQHRPAVPSTDHTPVHSPVHDQSPVVEELSTDDDHDDHDYDDPPEEEIVEDEHGRSKQGPVPLSSPSPSSSSPSAARTGEPRIQTHFHDRGKQPAYVAPIPKIGRIPSLSPIATPKDIPKDTPKDTASPDAVPGISSYGRPTLPRFLTARLVGKPIDEYGDVCDGDDVLGRVAGDLPSMVGRTISNENGDVLGDDGHELLGYVEHVTTDAERRSMQEARRRRAAAAAAQPLDEFTGGGSSAFRVDADGNILDGQGNIVGRMNKKGDGEDEDGNDQTRTKTQGEQKGGSPPRVNAESYRKEGESPSDIFLDVKSTTEGIQLTIRIPTVFPNTGQPPKMPNISFT
ncbi:uncharacterized protein SPSK_06432 [Sporothrix schenckii 1099-18]|uniref:Uncharacterized protein n=2 Tax=Sporothrix schenckii TaxID=29908 RepID=U7PL28_SPOS1|nr:uncharacterized protein SPSK_06432 [Sporothrix schenckii 1099-18]ERS95235.1 hypothetical protein HMPREF1624_08447 [Sporothrix schenckii ATCC 58251]KJR90037.1 hypothetical protein SPSK_06432 [Sporothrix schenckii 1099-18]